MILRPWLLLPLLALLGCSGGASKDTNLPKTYPVSGTITRNGAPVADASVLFQLVGGSRSATGMTDASGKYTLSTFTSNDGAPAGEYKVSVSKLGTSAAAGPAAGELRAASDDPNYSGPKDTGGAAAAPKNELPPQYANAETSGLKATVKETGENKFDFVLP
jgi:hypothetical protein